MDIVDLPRDLFLLIVAHLSARTAVACRRVSRRWNGAFADEDLGLRLLRWHFPRCRELRLALAAAADADAEAEASSPDGGVATTGHGDSPGHGAAEGQRTRGGAAPNSSGAGGAGRSSSSSSSSSRTCWAAVFARVARRYHHLRAAAPRSVEKVRHGATTAATAEEGDGGAWPGTPPPGFLPVRTWDRHLRLHDKTAPFHYPDPGWCYGQDDGLLVYHAAREDDDEEGSGAARPSPWRWLDLDTRRGGTIPFARRGGGAVVRRVRLADGVLVFEWCAPRAGRHPDHQAREDGDEEWPHFVTVYDVRRVAPATTDSDSDDSNGDSDGNSGIEQGEPDSGSATWTITQRTEFPLLPGWPINRHSRLFSTHTNTHHATYIWQGDRTSRDNHPVDVVVIRDISTTPPGQRQQQQEGPPREEPPRVVRTMSWDTLDFYGVRQRSAPRLRCLGMDDRNLYLTEEEHRWARGAHSSPSPPRVHLVRTTGIPIIPAAAAAAAAAIPSSLGGGQEVEGEGEKSRQVVVQGPRWVDECGANGDVNMSFCSRAAGASRAHGAPPQQHMSHPAAAGGGQVHSIPTGSGIQTRSCDEWPQPAAAAAGGGGGGAGRWPGWAPCWRHEEFPYLTVSEMVDLRAGVRVTARHCFMLETLSVHVRPSLSVRGLGGGGGGGRSDGRDDGDGGGVGSKGGGTSGPRSTGSEGGGGAGTRARPRKETRGGEEKRSDTHSSSGGDGDGDEEVQFADEMWDALLGKGFICGDERWLIGEDRQGAITILRF